MTAAEQRRARSEEQRRVREGQAQKVAAREQAAASQPTEKRGGLSCLVKCPLSSGFKKRFVVASQDRLQVFSKEPQGKPGKPDIDVRYCVDVKNTRGSTYAKKSTVTPEMTKDDHSKVGKEPPFYFGVNFYDTSSEGFEWLFLAADSAQDRAAWVEFLLHFCDPRKPSATR